MKVAGTALLVLCTVRNSSEYAYNYCTITITCTNITIHALIRTGPHININTNIRHAGLSLYIH